MEILYITNNYLMQPSGSSFGTAAYINAFDNISNNHVTLIYPQKTKNDVLNFINPSVNALGFTDNRTKAIKFIGYLFGKLTRFSTRQIDKIINKMNIQFDIVVLDGSQIGGTFVSYFKKNGIKTITIHHNVESEYHIDSKTPQSIWGYFPYFINKKEKEAVTKSDLNLTVTSYDAKKLQKLYDKNKNSAFINTGTFEYKKSQYNITPKVNINKNINCLLTGNLGDFQTLDGIIDFIKVYYPLMKKKMHNVHIVIAGRNPQASLYEICQPYKNISIIDTPSNMDIIIKNADIYICPTKLGGGIKMRILDGLKYGVPIITHEVSSRGYEYFFNYEWFLKYTNSNEFILALTSIVSRIKNHETNETNIREKYNEYFSFEAGLERVKKAILSL